MDKLSSQDRSIIATLAIKFNIRPDKQGLRELSSTRSKSITDSIRTSCLFSPFQSNDLILQQIMNAFKTFNSDKSLKIKLKINSFDTEYIAYLIECSFGSHSQKIALPVANCDVHKDSLVSFWRQKNTTPPPEAIPPLIYDEVLYLCNKKAAPTPQKTASKKDASLTKVNVAWIPTRVLRALTNKKRTFYIVEYVSIKNGQKMQLNHVSDDIAGIPYLYENLPLEEDVTEEVFDEGRSKVVGMFNTHAYILKDPSMLLDYHPEKTAT